MPRARFASPFAYQTPIGASLNNIAQALFAGPGPIEQDKMMAESELRRAQTQKAAAEVADLEDFRRRRGDPYQNETIALGTGVPLPNVEGYRSYIRGGVPMPPALPGGVDHGVLQDRFAALRTGTMDKTSTALDIAKAGGALTDQRREAGAQSGMIPRLDVENFARARMATEGKPLYGGDRFVTRDLSGGGTATTALGAAEIPNINAQAAQRRATAGNQAALADIHRTTARTGITPGPPVMVDVPNSVEGGGGLTSVSPQRTGGFPLVAPTRAAPAGGGKLVKTVVNGEEIWIPASEAAGKRAGGGRAAAQTKALSKQELGAIDAAIADSAGTDLRNIDGPTLTRLKARAAELALDPASDWHRNPSGAAEAAFAEMGGLEDTRSGIPFVSSRFVPKAGPTAPAPAIPAVAPPAAPRPAPQAQAGGGLPPAAAARLKEGVTTTFANGQTWMLQGGKAVQVQ